MTILARGFATGYVGVSQALLITIIVFLAIAIYNVIELHCIIFGTFKRRTGLYFWSFLLATWGIGLYCIGFLVKFFVPPSLGYLACTIILIGWVGMITGQSMVLWSRLHLVLWNERALRVMFWIIIINTVLIDVTITPIFYGSFSKNPEMWKAPYIVMEKIEVTTYFIQETVLSSFYIFEAFKLIKMERCLRNTQLYRHFMKHLILINFMVILLDITIVSLEYTNQYNIQTSYKPFVYSVKLKLEFTILNRLVEITRSRSRSSKDASSGPSGPRSRDVPVRPAVDLESFIDETTTKSPGGVAGISCQVCAMGGSAGPSHGAQQTLETRDDVSPTRHDIEIVEMTKVTVHREEETREETREGETREDNDIRRSIGRNSRDDLGISCVPAINDDGTSADDSARGRSKELAVERKP